MADKTEGVLAVKRYALVEISEKNGDWTFLRRAPSEISSLLDDPGNALLAEILVSRDAVKLDLWLHGPPSSGVDSLIEVLDKLGPVG